MVEGGWREQALCTTIPLADVDRIFFPPTETEETISEAKTICAQCPVQTQCLKNASDCAATAGIWAGQTTGDRETQGIPTQGTRPRPGTGSEHGTYSAWYRGCRCNRCMEAKRVYSVEQRKQIKQGPVKRSIQLPTWTPSKGNES